MRSRAKTINFATIYGQGAHALSRQLKIEHSEAKEFIRLYFERFHGIRAFLDSSVEFARTHGYVQTIFNRRRYIPELREKNFNMRAFGERTAANSPIQGSAADLIKIAASGGVLSESDPVDVPQLTPEELSAIVKQVEASNDPARKSMADYLALRTEAKLDASKWLFPSFGESGHLTRQHFARDLGVAVGARRQHGESRDDRHPDRQ